MPHLNKLCKYINYSIAAAIFILPLCANAYEYNDEEGKWVVRGKLGGTIVGSKEQEYVSGVPVNRTTAGAKIFDSSISAEFELDYFFYDHFSFGTTIGYMPQQAGEWSFGTRNDSGKVTAVPMAATAKYHVAPYGEIRPYITAGYHYTYFSSSYETLEFDNSSGPLAGIGTDWWVDKHWGINLEAKQYFMETSVDRTKLTHDNSITEVEINPLVLSAGFVYRF